MMSSERTQENMTETKVITERERERRWHITNYYHQALTDMNKVPEIHRLLLYTQQE